MAYPERIVPDETGPGIVAIHLKRYEFARRWCVDAEVLDAACGVGYGSAHLADVARRVVGVDVSEDAVAYARAHYDRSNVEFRQADLLEPGLPEAAFDVVCSFETIEHLPDPERFLGHVAQTLRPAGVLVVSTPQARRTTRTPENPFHHVEYARTDFEALLRGFFDDVELYGQRRLQTGRHRLMQRLDVLGLRRRLTFLRPAAAVLGTAPMAEVTAQGLAIDREHLERAAELVAVCRGPRP
ncbi:MAG: class I SAM-dependent methyltransferase [Gaiellaceae bacterium]